ncbi:leucine-rich repeat-containing protein 40-like [Panonychus citri]|uniref:leucine-rich repeat-containing protein 40-like n=1 Tax=Panonychus citri TaxID=50023 RepID=UPI002307620B|nr:leucine-rich repeat-containing protein 40-like [Panonychus citri]
MILGLVVANCFNPISFLIICLTLLSRLNNIITESCDDRFNTEIKGKCSCFNVLDDHGDVLGLGVECSETTGSDLHRDIDEIHFESSTPIVHLKVRDSNLKDMTDLPSGLVDIRWLVLDNTSIDLHVIRESAEILGNLDSLKLFNENYTLVPENVFHDGMNGLQTLWLNDIGIYSISRAAFHHLDDSLVELSLRENKLRSIPLAIIALMKIEILDLTDNEIQSVSEGLANDLSRSLHRVRKIMLNKINCTCNFAKSRFARWIRENAIKGVECGYPIRFKDHDVWSTPSEEFCSSGSSSVINLPLITLISSLLVIKLLFFT